MTAATRFARTLSVGADSADEPPDAAQPGEEGVLIIQTSLVCNQLTPLCRNVADSDLASKSCTLSLAIILLWFSLLTLS